MYYINPKKNGKKTKAIFCQKLFWHAKNLMYNCRRKTVKEEEMLFNDLMAKVRYWDNKMAKWMIRHFYILFFEVFLVLVFVGAFVITIKVLDTSAEVRNNTIEKFLMFQSLNAILITVLLLLNSFWMLYIFNEIIRTRSTLKEISFHLSKRKPD